MTARTIDINMVYREAHKSLAGLMNTVEMYHEQTLKLLEDGRNKDFEIISLKKKIEELQPSTKKAPNNPEPEK